MDELTDEIRAWLKREVPKVRACLREEAGLDEQQAWEVYHAMAFLSHCQAHGLRSYPPAFHEAMRRYTWEWNRRAINAILTPHLRDEHLHQARARGVRWLCWLHWAWQQERREEINAKVNAGKKIRDREVAEKSQIWTEQYMAEWMVQNSLGQAWFAICEKNGWQAEVVEGGLLGVSTLDALTARQAEWRALREAGEVDLEALMPLRTERERQWCYYVQRQPSPVFLETSPRSLRDFRIMEPAVGTGLFLVALFETMVPLLKEEARHRGEQWSARDIAETIVSAIDFADVDPRMVQVSEAIMWLLAKLHAPSSDPQPRSMLPPDLSGISDHEAAPLRDRLLEGGLDMAQWKKLWGELRELRRWGTLWKRERWEEWVHAEIAKWLEEIAPKHPEVFR